MVMEGEIGTDLFPNQIDLRCRHRIGGGRETVETLERVKAPI